MSVHSDSESKITPWDQDRGERRGAQRLIDSTHAIETENFVEIRRQLFEL